MAASAYSFVAGEARLVLEAARDAAYAAGYVASSASRADIVSYAASAAATAAAAAQDPDAECDWQRLRLAAYVLGEVE